MPDPVTMSVILNELLARPAQSRFSLAAHLRLAPSTIDGALQDLQNRGLLVASGNDDASEKFYWASEAAPEAVSAVAAGAMTTEPVGH